MLNILLCYTDNIENIEENRSIYLKMVQSASISANESSFEESSFEESKGNKSKVSEEGSMECVDSDEEQKEYISKQTKTQMLLKLLTSNMKTQKTQKDLK